MSKKSLSVAVALVVCLALSAQAQAPAPEKGRCPEVLFVGNCKTEVPAKVGGECLQPHVQACLKVAFGGEKKDLGAFKACAKTSFEGKLDDDQAKALLTCASSWSKVVINTCAGKSVSATATADGIELLWLDALGVADTDPWGNEQECNAPALDSTVCFNAKSQAKVMCAAKCLDYACLSGWILGTKSCGLAEHAAVSTSPSASTSTGVCVQKCTVQMDCTCGCN